jgi:hypothetical protein
MPEEDDGASKIAHGVDARFDMLRSVLNSMEINFDPDLDHGADAQFGVLRSVLNSTEINFEAPS